MKYQSSTDTEKLAKFLELSALLIRRDNIDIAEKIARRTAVSLSTLHNTGSYNEYVLDKI